jgi:hypothetical protein
MTTATYFVTFISADCQYENIISKATVPILALFWLVERIDGY